MATVRLGSVLVGRVGDTDIYRVDLSQSGFSTIGAITIHDDNNISGGGGSHSGMDLDLVKLLNTSVNDATAVSDLSGEAVFDFTNGVDFQPGFQTPVAAWDPPEWNTNLQGTSGANIYDPAKATLDSADSNELSLGEGGQVTLLLKSALSTSGRYFYYGETGSADLAGYVTVSDVPSAPPTDFTLFGTSGNDTIRLGTGANTHLQFTDTTVYGRGGNDTIVGASGDDTLRGESGKDWISGGSGNDWLHGGSGNDRLSGHAGSDTFVFNSKLGTARTDRQVNFDTITDFNVRDDSLWLDNAIFRKIGGGTLSNPKALHKEFFITGSQAREKDDYLIYNKKTGVLSYDADGSGSKEAVEFALLKKGLSLTYRDVFVI
jgi:Ca2+-binding RTX toxin-like protein